MDQSLANGWALSFRLKQENGLQKFGTFFPVQKPVEPFQNGDYADLQHLVRSIKSRPLLLTLRQVLHS